MQWNAPQEPQNLYGNRIQNLKFMNFYSSNYYVTSVQKLFMDLDNQCYASNRPSRAMIQNLNLQILNFFKKVSQWISNHA